MIKGNYKSLRSNNESEWSSVYTADCYKIKIKENKPFIITKKKILK